MKGDYFACRKSFCFIPTFLEKRRPETRIWPLLCLGPEITSANTSYPRYVWEFYVRWTDEHGSKLRRYLCEKHHKQVLAEFAAEAASDLFEQEVTDKWLVRTDSRMLCQSDSIA